MKRISLLILLLFIVIISIGFIPFNQQILIKIDASYFNCYQKLFNVDGWQSWYPDAKNKKTAITLINSQNVFEFTFPGETVLVKKENGNTLSIKKVINKKHINYFYSLIPDTNPLKASVIVTFKINLINYLIPSLRNSRVAETNVNCFKSYMEDAKQYYGFDIKTQFTADENTVVKSKTVSSKEAYSAVKQMQTELHNYVKLKHLERIGRVILQFIPKPNDSVQLLMGIPVNKKTVAENGFLYMYVPATKTVIADYSGKHQDRKEIYTALQKYLQDKYLHTKIPAFETYEGKMPLDGSDEVSFKLYCPVF
jgi:effector-binding domain-containing protein